MELKEISHILAAILVFTAVASLLPVFQGDFLFIPIAFGFSALIIITNILGKKIAAFLLDSNVEHELWFMSRYGIAQRQKLKSKIPVGIIFPLFFSLFSFGFIKILTFLTYETRALRRRAAKRFGFYSYTEMTDWHNALIGSSGVLFSLLLAVISYFLGLEVLSKLSIYYAFWNLIPISKLDGTQIFFGSRPLWYALAVIVSVLTALALIIP